MKFSEVVSIQLDADGGEADVIRTKKTEFMMAHEPLWMCDVLGDVILGLIELHNEAAQNCVKEYGVEACCQMQAVPIAPGLDTDGLDPALKVKVDEWYRIHTIDPAERVGGGVVLPFKKPKSLGPSKE
jgi:hypothetical protein